MSFCLSFFKLKEIFFLLTFLFTLFSMSKSFPKRKNSENNSDNENQNIKRKKFDTIPEASIDEDGVYKYIQIKCYKKYIFIRGSKDCYYHRNIYRKFLNELETNHLDKNYCKVLGGGRIEKNLKDKKIKIYGYSNTYGRVKNQHETTKKILEKAFPDYDISWTNDGY